MLERCWDFQNNSKEHFVFLNILRESRNLTWFLQCLRWTKQQQKESFEHNSEHGGVYIDINITFCHLVVVFFFFLLPFFVNWHRASWLLEKGIGGKRTLIPTYWECITFIIASSTHIQLFFFPFWDGWVISNAHLYISRDLSFLIARLCRPRSNQAFAVEEISQKTVLHQRFCIISSIYD